MAEALDALHAPLAPLLAQLLTYMPRRAARALDIGGGAGTKRPLIAAALQPSLLIGLDIDRAAVTAGYAPHAIAADAHALPLAGGYIDAALCIATIGLLADPHAALREAYRVLRPGGALLILTATQRYAQVTRRPPELEEALAPLLDTQPGRIANDDLAGEVRMLLVRAGFAPATIRAALIAGDTTGELPLLTWETLRPAAAAHLDATTIARGDALDPPEIELCTIALGAIALRA